MINIKTEADLASGVYAKRDVEIVRGLGSNIWDSSGKKYIDMGASYGVCNVGHCNPEVVEAIKRQAEKILYISSTYPNPVRRELLEKLITISPKGMARAFLCNSGTESVEAAIKFSILHTHRTGIVSAMRSYHGRTLGSLSATWNKKYREVFQDLLIPTSFVKFSDTEGLKDAVDSNTAAVLLEPIQGEGGVYVPDMDYFKAAKDICSDAGALLIVDEVQTGFGRTGKMFCSEHYGITPDIMCVGKSLGGGLPIGATVLHEKLGEMPKGMHGSTFGGNPIACAAANACIDFILNSNLPKHAAEQGEYFKSRLNDLRSDNMREVRGLGLMLALELKVKNTPFLNALLENGIAPLPGGTTTIRFLPPLIVENKEIDETITVLERFLNE
jgi:acetylornithine/LysW-gamma-L-lysine aminotransferase